MIVVCFFVILVSVSPFYSMQNDISNILLCRNNFFTHRYPPPHTLSLTSLMPPTKTPKRRAPSHTPVDVQPHPSGGGKSYTPEYRILLHLVVRKWTLQFLPSTRGGLYPRLNPSPRFRGFNPSVPALQKLCLRGDSREGENPLRCIP